MLNPMWLLAQQYIFTLHLYIYVLAKMLQITCFVIALINILDFKSMKTFERQLHSHSCHLMTVARNTEHFLSQKHNF